MSQIVVTTRIDLETAARLGQLADTFDRSRAWIVTQAIKRYVDEGIEFLDGLKTATDALDRGEFVAGDEMEREFADLLEPQHSRAA